MGRLKQQTLQVELERVHHAGGQLLLYGSDSPGIEIPHVIPEALTAQLAFFDWINALQEGLLVHIGHPTSPERERESGRRKRMDNPG
jgi:hypothetical protein